MDFENPCSFAQNETAMRRGCSTDISRPNLNTQSAPSLDNASDESQPPIQWKELCAERVKYYQTRE
ncbi:UNVERIFIED_CONTAM: hypothetical protein NCL1_53842 [Trichonephila clavipes]